MGDDPAANVAQDVALCPQCQTRLNFHRSHAPDIDSCGFESYQFKCQKCGAALVGIIDPADDALILSVCSSTADNS
jgi:hypothetical protein